MLRFVVPHHRIRGQGTSHDVATSPNLAMKSMRPSALQIALSVFLAGFVLLTLLGTTVSCVEDRPACYEGDFQACACPASKLGYQRCLEAEQRFAACVCDGTTPGVDGSIDEDAAADVAVSGGKIPFMGVCATNEECETGNCKNFPSRGSFCTHSCKLDTECLPPSGGCNPQGVCKAPQ
jgi:hypothetical protein